MLTSLFHSEKGHCMCSSFQFNPCLFLFFFQQQSEENFNPNCSFWSYSKRTMTGYWSTQDCRLLGTNRTHTTCSCTHLTNFAVLMAHVDVKVGKLVSLSRLSVGWFILKNIQFSKCSHKTWNCIDPPWFTQTVHSKMTGWQEKPEGPDSVEHCKAERHPCMFYISLGFWFRVKQSDKQQLLFSDLHSFL